ncbi:MAG TPA: PRC-barrel domain-containing protein [Alphaproteobacteria bacterium]|nr:PRC-barrel domain-containing protein [Alphaproteobacteria bacterium]
MARLIGRAVVDPDGATIGEIEDVVRLRRGGVNAVIASGGLFGLGVRRVAVPVGELEAPDATGPVAARRLTAAEAGALSAFDAAADAEFSYRSRVAQR